MQVSDMKVLRAICIHKHLLGPANGKLISNSSRISFQSVKNPTFSRHFHSTRSHLCSEESSLGINAPKAEKDQSLNGKARVWSVYNPVSDRVVTQRVTNSNDGQISEGETNMGLSSLEEAVEALPEERTYGSTKKSKLGQGSLSVGNIVRNQKKGKAKTSWVCNNCGNVTGQWWGTCRSCHAVGTLKQFSEANYGDKDTISGFEVSENVLRSWLPQQKDEAGPMRLTEISRGMSQQDWRIAL